MGESRRVSLPRRWVIDLLHACRNRPLIPMERRANLTPLIQARSALNHQPGWCTLFTKAYAIVSARRPQFRDAYLPLPWPRLFRYPDTLASIIIERQYEGENILLPYYLRNANHLSIKEIDKRLRHAKTSPITEIKAFRRALRLCRCPQPLRRLLWWTALNAWGRQRARFFGTFGVSVTAGMGAGQLAVISPTTSTLHYGCFEPGGILPIRVTFDHRVLDGADVARAMAELEGVLLNEILAEVRQLAVAETLALTPNRAKKVRAESGVAAHALWRASDGTHS